MPFVNKFTVLYSILIVCIVITTGAMAILFGEVRELNASLDTLESEVSTSLDNALTSKEKIEVLESTIETMKNTPVAPMIDMTDASDILSKMESMQNELGD